jgi:hypothetical protein
MTKPGLPNARYERFDGMREYDAMFDELIPKTQRVIRVFDRALSRDYNSLARCQALAQFLKSDSMNRLELVVHATAGIERVCPRFVTLLQRYGHVAKVRQTPRWARHVYDPFIVFDASHYLHRFHYERMGFARGLNELEGTQQLLERFGELWEASQPAFGASVLGL